MDLIIKKDRNDSSAAIIELEEYSFGVVPLVFDQSGNVYALMVLQKAGHWSFPKGHALPDETPLMAAERELKEETGISAVKWLPLESIMDEYVFERDGKKINKKVIYFFAQVAHFTLDNKKNETRFPSLDIQVDEICEARFVPVREMEGLVSFPEMKKLCKTICEITRSLVFS